MNDATITVNARVDVNIPALDNYVAYLREKDATQKKLDALTAEFQEVTARLHASTASVQQAVDQQSQQTKG